MGKSEQSKLSAHPHSSQPKEPTDEGEKVKLAVGIDWNRQLGS